ncbi:MAG: LPS-assembly protein LptD [Sphingomonadaceae bacterium]
MSVPVQVNVTRLKTLWLAMLLTTVATPALAQAEQQAPGESASAASKNEVDFAADTLDYNNETDVVTARGNVVMLRDGNRLRADDVVWDRKSGQVVAKGNVEAIDPKGNKAYGDAIELTDTLKDGIVENLLIVLNDGGRLVAKKGARGTGVTRLDRAAYSPCAVENERGCPIEPVWKISAISVVHDPVKNRIYYKGARLELFGVPLIVLPGLSHPADNAGGTGFLVPGIQITRTNGLELSTPYYLKISNNRDLIVTPHIFSGALPAIETQYRALTGTGAYQVRGYATYSSRLPAGVTSSTPQQAFRGYLDVSGRFQLTPQLSITGSSRLVTDRTFLRRYDISRDDRLRTTIDVERVTPDSYFSLSGWGFETLRPNDRQGQVPIVLPLVDFRRRLTDPLLGGRFDLQLNSVAIGRTAGQDTQRAFAGLRWDLRRITGWGQEVIFTGYTRGDVYHTDEIERTATISYRGRNGWQARFLSAAAAEIRWPLIGRAFGGTQTLTPRLQLVAAPRTKNVELPNEDARAVDLEDSNLFALNRFPGYDRFEDGTRLTYGLDWGLARPGLKIDANIGQSYRLSSKPSLFLDGTGLTDRVSDIVGRTTIRFRNLVSFTHRYRLDKDNFAIRRNEVDATFGNARTNATIGYLQLNRDVTPGVEDLRDREEIRVSGRVQVARFWSLFGSAIVDLTGRRDDPTSTSDGFQPIRHRIGVQYEDDCLQLGVSWRRDYESSGDVVRGNTFQLRLSFRHLGR